MGGLGTPRLWQASGRSRKDKHLNVALQGAERPAGPVILTREGLVSKRE